MSLKVSIIIPVYNVEKYVKRCLNSVISQTYKNLECIIVEDVSTDKSGMIIHSFIDSYHGHIPFFVIQHEENKGLSEARNTGTVHATGDFIFYLDSDDEIFPNCIEILVRKAESYPGVDIIQGNTMLKPAKDNNYYELRRYNLPNSLTNNEDIRRFFYDPWRPFPVTAWNKLIRTSFIKDNGLFFLKGVIHEDFHWLYKSINYLQSIIFVLDYTYIHYIVPNSIMSSTNEEKSGKSTGIILSDLLYQIDESDFRRQFIKYVNILALNFLRTPYVKELKTANLLFSKKAKSNHWYSIYIILTFTRILSVNKIGNKLGALFTLKWVNHQRQCRKWDYNTL